MTMSSAGLDPLALLNALRCDSSLQRRLRHRGIGFRWPSLRPGCVQQSGVRVGLDHGARRVV